MTPIRWLAVAATALLLGGAAQAQYAPPPPQAHFYYESPQICYPPAPMVAPTNPVVLKQVFEAMARRHAASTEHSVPNQRPESTKRRLVAELLKLYRPFYTQGHWRAAEMAAVKALELDPNNVAAEHAAICARLANHATTSASTGCTEECSPSERVRCTGVCGSKCNCKDNCSCGEKCKCCPAKSDSRCRA